MFDGRLDLEKSYLIWKTVLQCSVVDFTLQ